ncbi:MAG: hypothetical protein IKO36_12725 [Bacteroidaceae bacterium]|nr:hypothetical protein [Bacteroidaceae bacterium]
MAGFPDIRLYKSNYTADESKRISKEKGSIVFSSATKRIYVGNEQYGSNIQDIKWTPDTQKEEYTLDINKVNKSDDISIKWCNSDKSLYVTQNGQTEKILSLVVDVSDVKTTNKIYAKNLKTSKDEVIINENTNIQDALQTLARQFEQRFIWYEWDQ